jgi:2-polyprenyl-6-methoxyphenol hydroxylase-like FAD-dependent oxidoreductase
VDEHVVVVGGVPADLAAAWAIRLAGIDPLVIERADSAPSTGGRNFDA